MRLFPAILSVALVSFLFGAALCSAQTPTFTIIDEGGTPHAAPDNSAVVQTTPGGRLVFEVTGKPNLRYAVAYSEQTSGNMTGFFLKSPFIYLLPGTNHLDGTGYASFSVTVPRGFVWNDLDLYIQGAVFESGYTLTNGITLEIVVPSTNADLAIHFGPHPGLGQGLNAIEEIGRLDDDMAEDNVVNGSGIDNGEAITQAPDFAGEILAYLDQGTPTDRHPLPSNSIFLNGQSYLIPGDTGLHPDFTYPKRGSQMEIHSRNAVCRNCENPAVQHIVIPPIAGGQAEDLNLYHIKLNSTPAKPTYAFATLNVATNEFKVIPGTEKPFDQLLDTDHVSAWDANVAISPDRKLMAAVRKNRGVFAYEDQVNVIRLDGQTWPSTGNAVLPIKAELTGVGQKTPDIIFPETLTFLETEVPGEFFLYWASNYNSTSGAQDPGKKAVSMLWRYSTAASVAEGVNFDAGFTLPRTGNGYPARYMGNTHQYSTADYPTNPQISDVRWIKSADSRTLCFAAAGRDNNADPWEWDMYSITNCQTTGGGTETITNITQFKTVLQEILPFTRCTNGECKVAIADDGTRIAFVVREALTEDEDLMFYQTDGSDVGLPGLLTSGSFNLTIPSGTYQVVDDPCVVGNEECLFFAGMKSSASGTVNTDLYYYNWSTDKYFNITNTATNQVPPFKDVGKILPAGYFMTPDKEKLYFFRGMMVGTTKQINLVGVDIVNNYSLFGCSGDEFNGGVQIVPDIAIEQSIGLHYMNIAYCASPDPECLLFTARYKDPLTNRSYQVFRLDLANPFATLPITSFPSGSPGLIDNLVADETGMMVAFSRSNVADQTADTKEKIFAVDVNSFAYTRDLTPNNNYDAACVDGSIRFIPGETLPPNFMHPQLVYAFGLGTDGANNPFPARAWVFPLNILSKHQLPSISYPLTAEGSVYIYSAKP